MRADIDSSRDRLPRLWRLMLKELREILRDRRTIVTLVLMPLLLYPLLTVAFQQLFMSQLGAIRVPRYTVGFQNERQAQYLRYVLLQGGLTLIDVRGEAPPADAGAPRRPVVEAGVRPELEHGLREFDIDLGMRVRGDPPLHFDVDEDLSMEVELLYRDDTLESREALALIEKHLRKASDLFLSGRLHALRVSQRPVPFEMMPRTVTVPEGASGRIQITAVIPFVLILMTITGAVYPAIDLTAGERERGTLEVLVAAPIPRIGVLFAKYVAVLTVALLTAAANLVTMTITLSVSGLGRLLFGEGGISPGVMAAVFGLLLLFAAFFSAVLLVITSCARSFKEAQAYLIPLMLVALAPGVLSLMPGLELSGLLLVTPLANIVLLGRDLFALKASGGAALTVVISTLIYSAAAIGLAARVFGAESVLYSDQSGWADLFRRPRAPQAAPTPTAAAFCLALMFPLYFAAINLLGGGEEVREQLASGVAITILVFGAVPGLACWVRRVPLSAIVGNGAPTLAAYAGALLAGLTLWMLCHETVVWSKELRGVALDPQFLERLGEYAARLRSVPVWLVLMAMAVVPAVFEETFFRGYLFAALRRSTNATTTVVVTAVAFGLFHAIVPNPLASERLVSSALAGLVLGLVRWRTGSLLPGVLLHVCHNGLLMLLVCYEPQLTARGFAVGESQHLPPAWLAGGLTVLAVGLALTLLRGNTGAADDD